jgi:hypothetical protein
MEDHHIRGLEERLAKLADELEAARHRVCSSSGGTGDDGDERLSPLGLLERVRALQRDAMPALRAEAERVVVLKQELVDSVGRRTAVAACRERILALQSAAGVPQMPAAGPFADMLAAFAAWDRTSGIASASHDAMSLQMVRSRPAVPSTSAAAMATTSEATETTATTASTTTSSMRRANRGLQFEEITEEEFAKVSSLVRGRAKLDDVNKLYRAIHGLFTSGPMRRREPATVAELSGMGCKVAGLSGESKIGVLRSLRLIDVTKQGITLISHRTSKSSK